MKRRRLSRNVSAACKIMPPKLPFRVTVCNKGRSQGRVADDCPATAKPAKAACFGNLLEKQPVSHAVQLDGPCGAEVRALPVSAQVGPASPAGESDAWHASKAGQSKLGWVTAGPRGLRSLHSRQAVSPVGFLLVGFVLRPSRVCQNVKPFNSRRPATPEDCPPAALAYATAFSHRVNYARRDGAN